MFSSTKTKKIPILPKLQKQRKDDALNEGNPIKETKNAEVNE